LTESSIWELNGNDCVRTTTAKLSFGEIQK
jgi:hypothetical protein